MLRHDRNDREPSGTREAMSLHGYAAENVAFIRRTMERSAAFAAVPGAGAILIGGTALVAAWVAREMGSPRAWLITWLVAAVVAAFMGALSMHLEARADGTTLLSPAGRRFFAALLPPIFAGAVLTPVLWRFGPEVYLPALWLLLYGVGVHSAGMHSIKKVSVLGLSFMLLGALGLLVGPSLGDALMALGFGGFHIVFGLSVIIDGRRRTELS